MKTKERERDEKYKNINKVEEKREKIRKKARKKKGERKKKVTYCKLHSP